MTKSEESENSEDQNKTEGNEETTESESKEEEKSEETDKQEKDAESEGEEEEESSKHLENERDYDAELEEEQRSEGIAHEKFKERKEKRETENDDDKPLTRGEWKRLANETQKVQLEAAALALALTITDSDKEAKLVVAKWKNRGYPTNLSLQEQIEEAYVATHRKTILGQANEAKRALRNKSRVNDNAAGTHRESTNPNEPKISEAEKFSLKKAGFEYNPKTRRYEKKLPNGVLVRDPQTKKAVKL